MEQLTPKRTLVELGDSPKYLNLPSLAFGTAEIDICDGKFTSVQIEHPLGFLDVQVNLYGLNDEGQIIDGMTYKQNDPCPCGSGKKYKKCCGK
ncbi:SEC-C metal-binding domain-containing protein [Desulfitobacterium sp.]|uniref:SEC-C metal-binding domain-containing protein n=1 Tax=Desulfitobacterium sp. TaxID=49981 RepID=UPI002B1ED530|nr:SEC-C metal-binding domain-containing protein [Desulfitobacterium sp.]MEA4900762.1 SEC-C metal-binding domain-containing protein [Desulfitobacterium sp.]